jgi:hypothetical protein
LLAFNICGATSLCFLAPGSFPGGVGIVGAVGVLFDFKKPGIGNFAIMLPNFEPCEFLKPTVLMGAAECEVSMGLKVNWVPAAGLPADDSP